MKYPIEPTPSFRSAFTLTQFDLWVDRYKPAEIELSDRQYAWLAALMRENVKNYRGIPIVFVDAPKAA